MVYFSMPHSFHLFHSVHIILIHNETKVKLSQIQRKIMCFTKGNMAYVTNRNFKFNSKNLLNNAGLVYYKTMHAISVKYMVEIACNLVIKQWC